MTYWVPILYEPVRQTHEARPRCRCYPETTWEWGDEHSETPHLGHRQRAE